MDISQLQGLMRSIHDFPKEGIIFKDITPILGDAEAFRFLVDLFAVQAREAKADFVASIDARGFIIGGAAAYAAGAGFIPLRKAGKLPYKTYRESYELEYGEAVLEIHQDAVKPGDKVFLLDDLLATGGTALAGAKLIERCGGEVVGMGFLMELGFLHGREKLKGYDISSLFLD